MTQGQPGSQQFVSPSQSFQCNHCVLLFKSKYFLLEHMKKVHGVDVDPSQSEGSSTPSESSTPPHSSTHYNSSKKVFSCRHCVFMSSSWTVIIKHEKTYHKAPVRGPGKGGTLKTQKRYLRGKRLNAKVSLPGKKNHKNVSARQLKKGDVGRVNSKSTLKTINIPSSSLLLKNLQTQVGSSGNCSKFRVTPGSSAHESSLNSLQLKMSTLPRPSRARDVTVMSDAPFHSYDQDNGKGVSKVTDERFNSESEQMGSHCCSLCNFSATWLEDLHTHQRSKHSYLFYSVGPSLRDKTVTEQRNLKPETYNGMSLTEPLAKTTKKRTHDDTCLNPAKKNIKTSPNSTVIQSKLSGGTAFTFEVSEDEEEENAWGTELDASGNEMEDQLANGESGDNPKKLYRCKHCDYSHKSSRSVSTHYQRMHPYIRYDFQYIMNPDDWTATFRCLECPVEFAAPDDLKQHYRDHHPEAPNVFMMRSDQLDLVYKCFACPFTISNGKYLKPHYKNKHPKLKMSNPLMYCSFTTKPSEHEPSKSQYVGQTSSLKNAEDVSPERSPTPHKETVDITHTPSKACSASMGVDVELYHCKHCVFSNKSVVVMLVHYQKSHPKAGLTIDSIKQASLATSRKPKDETQVSSENMVLEPFKLPEVKAPNISLSRPDVAQEDAENMFFCQHCNYGNLTVRGVLNHQRSRHRDLKASVEQIHLHTAEVRSQCKTSQGIVIVSPSTPLQNDVAQEEVLKPFKLPEVKSPNTSPPISNVSQADVESPYFCQFCDYCNPTVRGIMNHQKLKHSTRKSTAESIIKHTAVIRSSSNVTADNVNEVADLFFCQYCNYGNPSVAGVLNHQKLRHRYLQISTNQILQYTSELRSQKSTSQSAGFGAPNSSLLRSDVGNEAGNLFFCQFCNYGDPSMSGIFNHQKRRHGELKTTPDDIFRHTAEVRGQMKTSEESKRVNSTNSSHILPLPLVTEEAVLFCQLCNYSNPTMSGVMDHQRKRHPDLKATHKQILEYTAAMILAQSGKSPHSSFLTSEVFQEELEKFFCQYCDYSNSTVRGILNHQNKMHGDLDTNAAQILRHTVVIQGQTKQSQSKAVHSPNSPHILSRPLLKDEVVDMFFCQLCNYSNPTVIGVLNHQRKRHLDMKLTAKQILEYTATVMGKSQPVREDTLNSSQEEEGKLFYCQHCDYDNPTVRGVLNHQKLRHSDLPATADQVVRYTTIVCSPPKKCITQQPKKSSVKASQSRTQKAAPLRSLKCRKCAYITPHIYLLKRHLRNNHQEKAPITTIMRWAYQDGHLQAGYHCEWCVCSHTEAKGLLRHYRQRHPDKNTGLESIILRLHVGPKTRSKTIKPNTECNVKHENITLRFGEVPKTSPSFHSGEGDTKVYPCRACSFKATSMGGIGSHYRVVHPWSVKEDGSVLDVISSRQTQEPGVHEEQAVHETLRSSETHMCPVCSGEFNTLHGMFTHCGKKHPEYDMKVHEQPDVHETSKPSQRYRCPVCSGEFNTLHGMFTHCGKKHPEYDMKVHEQSDVHETSKPSQRYRCPVCSGEFNTLHGMFTHCGKKHPEYDMKVHEQPDVHETSKPSQRYRCPVCSGEFNTLHGMLTHCGKKHPEYDPSTCEKKPESSTGDGTLVFKCSICPYVNSRSHGVLTHCQMRHPATKARTERLEQEIVHFSDPDECVKVRSGKRIGLAGFQCNMCPVIHAKFKKLKAHYEMDHKRSASNMFKPALKQSAAIKKQLLSKYRGSQTSIAQAAILKNRKTVIVKCHLCKYFCTTKKGLARHLRINHSTYLAAHYRRQHDNAAFNNHFVPAFRPHRIPPTSPHRPGTIKPFHCGLCQYRTTILSLLKNHLLKVHGGEAYPSKNLPSSVTGSQDKEHTLRASEEAPNLPEPQEVTECNVVLISSVLSITEPVYLEPPDVQRQLNHYRQVAQASRHPAQQGTATTQDALFVCEFCIYTSTHIKSMRRHYINRHNGKRLVRCKDCSFFTGFRKKLDMHIETAHASSATEAPKDLRCPLCLYHTKNKNCMIDHILLHREEPVAPIEVRRPRLSRYLQGLVFRCHKCTFTSSSDEKLHLHMLIKHDDIKPYKCRLCYFDFTQLSELEAHLCDKHQVSTRLGRVNREKEMKCDQELGNEEEINKHGEKQGLEEEEENADKLRNKEKEETNRRHSEKQQVLEEGENIEKLGKEEEKDQEETNRRLKETQGLKEGDTVEEKRFEKKGENIVPKKYEFQGYENKGNVEEKSMDCEENQGQQDEVNKDGDNEVSENSAQSSEFYQSHDFSYEENKEEQYEECHGELEHEDKEMAEEQFMDFEEENRDLGEMDIGEQNNQYHEMPVLKNEACNYHEMPVLENEEGKEETHRNPSEKQEHEEEVVKNDSLKPECNTKQEQGSVEDEKSEENPMSDDKQDHENGNTSAPKGMYIFT
uniref:Zinc finger protein 462-like n=1 Tax=Salmo trutta TaxID=8032 RepID=A0A673XC57_SALTR